MFKSSLALIGIPVGLLFITLAVAMLFWFIR
jgi:hypothetical protein